MRSEDRRNRLPFYTIPIGGKWRRIEDKWMRTELLDDSLEEYFALDDLIFQYQMNPLAFSLPHGAKRKDKHKNDGIAFINDRKSEIMTVTAGSQAGKSWLGAVKMLMHIIPTDPEWACFKEHGLDWHEWKGPQKAIVASLKFEPNVRIVWETYMQIAPRYELGEYAPSYGSMAGEKGMGKRLSFKQGAQVVRLACGSEITLLSYHQNINSFESMQADIAHCDEQPKEQQYDAIAARQRTRGDYTPIFATMTPIMIDGRSDTGAAGFLIKDVMGKKKAKGRKVSDYKITIDSVPDVFMSKDKKTQMYEECIGEPMRNNNDIQLRHGRARYYGEPEVGGGGIIASFNPEVHMIEAFDVNEFRPTWMRFVDHGTKPCAAINVAMMPWGDFVIIDEYYEWNPSIRVHAQKLVEEFYGNERIQVSTYSEDGATFPVYEEQQTNHEYYVSECDINSFNSPSISSSLSIGQVYNQSGFRCSPSGNPHRKDSGTIDILNDMFALDKARKHINKRLNRPIPEASERSGAPAIYMFNHCKHIKAEIEGWIENPKTGKPMDADDHLVSCLTGDTLITTDKGAERIDNMCVGDKVLTRDGYKEVEAAEKTGNREIWKLTFPFSPQSPMVRGMLFGTANHPVYDAKLDKFVELSDITNDTVLLQYDRGTRNIYATPPENTGETEDVYNLQVKDCPEYFANGILVHNCMLFMASRPRRYMGDYFINNIIEEKQAKRSVDEFSKY